MSTRLLFGEEDNAFVVSRADEITPADREWIGSCCNENEYRLEQCTILDRIVSPAIYSRDILKEISLCDSPSVFFV
jgi:hypothetical protein